MAEKKMVDVFSDVERETSMAANPAGYVVTELGADDERIVTLAADMSNMVAEFIAKFPDRYVEGFGRRQSADFDEQRHRPFLERDRFKLKRSTL